MEPDNDAHGDVHVDTDNQRMNMAGLLSIGIQLHAHSQ